MAGAHFTFKTTAFADAPEVRAQNVNDIAGHALTAWLRQQLTSHGLAVSDDWPEDHGWDFHVDHEGSRYLCACSIEPDQEPPFEAHIGLHKMRSFKERVLGRNRYERGDAVTACIRTSLAQCREVSDLSEEFEL